MTSWQRPYSEIRASDAERERVVNFVREHALLGRLSDDELEDRIGLAYAAVTVGDLERLIADLPRTAHPAPRSRRAPARRRRPTGPALFLAGLALLVLPMAAMTAVAVALLTAFAVGFALGPFILVALILVHAMRRRRPPPPQSMRWGHTA